MANFKEGQTIKCKRDMYDDEIHEGVMIKMPQGGESLMPEKGPIKTSTSSPRHIAENEETHTYETLPEDSPSTPNSQPPMPRQQDSNKERIQKPLPLSFQFAAGAIAGVSEICVMYPLDVVKTRFQIQHGKSEYSSIIDCFRKIVRLEGFGRLYRGIVAPVMIEAPKRATKFAANEQYSKLYLSLSGQKKMTQPLSIATGVSAGITEAFVVVSFELVKIRMQDKANAGKYRNTVDCALKIFREEGPLAFFKGLESTIWRHAMWNGGYFGVIHSVKSTLPAPKSPAEQLVNNFIAGSIGGTFGTILNTPFDVVKTRIQNQAVPKYNWALPALGTIVREEGFSALYKGFMPKVLRLGPGGGILLVVFDAVTSWMRNHLMQETIKA